MSADTYPLSNQRFKLGYFWLIERSLDPGEVDLSNIREFLSKSKTFSEYSEIFLNRKENISLVALKEKESIYIPSDKNSSDLFPMYTNTKVSELHLYLQDLYERTWNAFSKNPGIRNLIFQRN